MDKNKRPEFPEGFFTQSRPTVNNKGAFKDIIPIKWSKDVSDGKSKAIVFSANEKKVL